MCALARRAVCPHPTGPSVAGSLSSFGSLHLQVLCKLPATLVLVVVPVGRPFIPLARVRDPSAWRPLFRGFGAISLETVEILTCTLCRTTVAAAAAGNSNSNSKQLGPPEQSKMKKHATKLHWHKKKLPPPLLRYFCARTRMMQHVMVCPVPHDSVQPVHHELHPPMLLLRAAAAACCCVLLFCASCCCS